eukprot:NODE_377_length_8484_cov_0.957782.p6 type:complete len:126 gc:universal NODE_377_length_8484_cov_0.957782:7638-7261(-)
MEVESRLKVSQLKVDGGVSNSNCLIQIQSNVLQIPILRPNMRETTAFGCAYCAGVSCGIFEPFSNVSTHLEHFIPQKFPTKTEKEWMKRLKHTLPEIPNNTVKIASVLGLSCLIIAWKLFRNYSK